MSSPASADAGPELIAEKPTRRPRKTPDEVLAEAIDLIRAEPNDVDRVHVHLLRWLSHQLVREGFPEDRTLSALERAGPAIKELHAALAKHGSWRAQSYALHVLSARLVRPIIAEYRRDPSKFPTNKERAIAHGRADLVEKRPPSSVEYETLPNSVGALLEERLRKEGMSEAQAAEVAHSTMEGFQISAGPSVDLTDLARANAAVDFAVAAIKAMQGASANFGQAAKIALPPRAPEIWMERDRSKGETPVAFLKRVWGPYWDALVQSDIKRLGDPKLLSAVRVYCHRHGIDASTVLPPPRQARIDRALAEADPDSPEAAALRDRVLSRQRGARWRQARKP